MRMIRNVLWNFWVPKMCLTCSTTYSYCCCCLVLKNIWGLARFPPAMPTFPGKKLLSTPFQDLYLRSSSGWNSPINACTAGYSCCPTAIIWSRNWEPHLEIKLSHSVGNIIWKARLICGKEKQPKHITIHNASIMETPVAHNCIELKLKE